MNSAQRTPTLLDCKSVNGVFPIKKKFTDMRTIMKKVHEISKNPSLLCQDIRNHYRSPKSSVLS
jgi:hypothetical protein